MEYTVIGYDGYKYKSIECTADNAQEAANKVSGVRRTIVLGSEAYMITEDKINFTALAVIEGHHKVTIVNEEG